MYTRRYRGFPNVIKEERKIKPQLITDNSADPKHFKAIFEQGQSNKLASELR